MNIMDFPKKMITKSLQTGIELRVKEYRKEGITDDKELYDKIMKRLEEKNPSLLPRMASYGITAVDVDNMIYATIEKYKG